MSDERKTVELEDSALEEVAGGANVAGISSDRLQVKALFSNAANGDDVNAANTGVTGGNVVAISVENLPKSYF